VDMRVVGFLSPRTHGPLSGGRSGCRWEGFELGEESLDRGSAWGMMTRI